MQQITREYRRFMRAYMGIMTSIMMIIISLAGAYWGILPFGRKLLATYGELNKARKTVEIMEAKYSILSSQSEVDLQKNTSELLRAIPPDKNVATAISTIEQTANSSGVTLESLTLLNPGSLATQAAQRQTEQEKDLGTGIISASVTVEGTIAQIQALLNSFQNVRRLLRVTSVEFVARDNGIAQASISVDSYYAPLPTTLSAPTEKIEPLSTKEEELLGKIAAYPIAYQTLSDSTSPIESTFKEDPFSP